MTQTLTIGGLAVIFISLLGLTFRAIRQFKK